MNSLLERAMQPARDLGATAIRGPLRALRHADFRRFLSGQGVSLIGTWMQSIAEGWLVFQLTHSAFAVGLTTTLATLPILLLTLYGGVVADRVDKRRFIMALQTVMLLEASSLAVLTITHHITVHLVWGLAVIFGFATAFEVPARQAFLVELVPAQDLVSAAAINSTTYNLARVIGPAIAGVLVAVAGPGAAFAVNALSYIAVLIGLSRIQKVHVPKAHDARESVFTGIRFIRSQPVLSGLAMQMVLLTVFAGSFVPILAVYASDVLKVNASGYGLLTSAVGVGAAIGAIGIGAMSEQFSRPRIAVIAATVLGLAVILLAGMRTLPLALLVLSFAGAAMASQGIVTATGLQLAAPAELRGRVMAVYSFVVLGLAPIGAFQAGFVAEHLGAPWSIAISGVITLIGTAILKRRLWHGVA
ncbi:MAG TPA: MFS transporter [Gemmatimonadales bacterium]|jgi:MFS family permease